MNIQSNSYPPLLQNAIIYQNMNSNLFISPWLILSVPRSSNIIETSFWRLDHIAKQWNWIKGLGSNIYYTVKSKIMISFRHVASLETTPDYSSSITKLPTVVLVSTCHFNLVYLCRCMFCRLTINRSLRVTLFKSFTKCTNVKR